MAAPEPAMLVGKRVGQHAYHHRDAVAELPAAAAELVWEAEALAGASHWTVVKLDGPPVRRISLLTYEDFETPFPALLESLCVDLELRRVTRRSYRGRANPPVLHRKELVLPQNDVRRGRYAQLTTALERHGLLREGRYIGTRLAWTRRLREAGVEVVDHELRPVRVDECAPALEIHRHRAAIRRDGLSTPVQALLRFGLIEPSTTVFDYGCGYGSDVEGLRASGVEAQGWDPHFAPDAVREPADVVNLGFVLNVIERPLERVDALKAAFALARRCLAVAVITSSSARLETCRPYGDGYVTRLGTFQKFFQPSELKTLIEGALGREAIPVGQGLFFVFRDPLAEQEFLLARQTRRPASAVALAARRTLARAARVEAVRHLLEDLWGVAHDLGRWPLADELPSELADALAQAAGSLNAGLKLAVALVDADALIQLAAERRDDLSVYFALNLFNGRTRYGTLPLRLQRDVRSVFGDHASAQQAGRDLLFSLAGPEVVAGAAAVAACRGLGWLGEEDDYWVCAELAPRLPAALRCYAGCAERFLGGFQGADLLKFHLRSGKLTALAYQDFATSPLPRLERRTKIDLRAQRIRDFDHANEDQRLLFKSRFMAADQPGYAAQAAFDQRAAAAGLAELGLRAGGAEIVSRLRAAGVGALNPSPQPAG